MKLNEWTAPAELVDLVDEAINGIPPIDEQVARCSKELYEVAGKRASIAYGAAIRAYVEALTYAAQLKVERDRLAGEASKLAYDNADWIAARDMLLAERDAAIAARDSLARRVEALERMVERSSV